MIEFLQKKITSILYVLGAKPDESTTVWSLNIFTKDHLLRILDANLERLNKMNETKLSIFEEDLFIQFYVFNGHISHFSIQVDDITGFNNWIAQSGRDLLR